MNGIVYSGWHRKQIVYINYILIFLRDMLKNQPYVVLAYMTGILPIKKYGGTFSIEYV